MAQMSILEVKACKLFNRPKTQNIGWRRTSPVNCSFSSFKTTSNSFSSLTTTKFSQFHNKYTTNYSPNNFTSIFQHQKIFNRQYTTTPDKENKNEINTPNKKPIDPRSFPKDRSFDPREPLINIDQTTTRKTEESSGNGFMKLITTSSMPIAKQILMYGVFSGVGFEIIKSQTIIDFPTGNFVSGGMIYGGLTGCLMSFIVISDYLLVEQKVVSSLSSEIMRKVNLSGGLKGGISAKDLKKIFEVDLKKYLDSSVSTRNFLLFNVISLLIPRFDSVYDSLSRRLSETEISPNSSASEILVTGLIEGVVRSQLLGWYDRFFYLAILIFLVLFIVAVAILYTIQKSKIVYGIVKEKVSDKISDMQVQKEEIIEKLEQRKDEFIEKAAEKKTKIVSSVQEKIPENTNEKITNTKDKVVEVKDRILYSVKEKMNKKEEMNVEKGVIDTPLGEKTVDILDPSDPRSKNYVRFDSQNPETWEDPNLLQTNYKVNLLMREDELREKEGEERSKE